MQHKWTLRAHGEMSSGHSSGSGRSRSCFIGEVDCWQCAYGEREREWGSAAEIVALAGRKCCQRNRNVLAALSPLSPFLSISLLLSPISCCPSAPLQLLFLCCSTVPSTVQWAQQSVVACRPSLYFWLQVVAAEGVAATEAAALALSCIGSWFKWLLHTTGRPFN